MSRNWETLTKNGMMYGLASAIFFAGVFALLSLSGGFGSDVIFGAIAGAISGSIVAIVVGAVDQELMRKEVATGIVTKAGITPMVGTFAGAIITTAVVIGMVQLIGFVDRPQAVVIFGVSLCCLIGTPLGMIIGLLIGASWRS